jgi:transcriptional regulator with XRE-family HTH domain
MLPLAKIKEVERLLAETCLSQRKIAQLAGVSRATVGAVASGRRPDYEARELARADDCQPTGPIVRCATCGARVYSPCWVCRMREANTEERERIKTFRRRAREAALRRLLLAVAKASEARERDVTYPPRSRPMSSSARPTANSGTSREVPAALASRAAARASATRRTA